MAKPLTKEEEKAIMEFTDETALSYMNTAPPCGCSTCTEPGNSEVKEMHKNWGEYLGNMPHL